MTKDVRLAVVGAGLIGKCHISSINLAIGAALVCIVDPSEAVQVFAESCGVDRYSSIDEMFKKTDVDGVILATPSQLHVTGAMSCVENRCPVLIEKPIGIEVNEAETLVAAAKSANIPVLTGHHRRHGAVIQKAKQLIDQGALGTIVAFQGTCWFHKPDDYFDAQWRSRSGGGPVFINLIHDINTMLYLLGDVASVHAMGANMIRGGEVEDTAAIVLRFRSGVLGTITLSDTVAAPWSWEMTSGENPAFPKTNEACYLIGGTQASLSLPNLSLWRHDGPQDWLKPIDVEHNSVEAQDPLVEQIHQFVAVIRGKESPLVSGEDGLRTLRVVEAVKNSIATGQTINLD